MVFTPFSWEEKTKMMIASSRGKSNLCKVKFINELIIRW